MTLVLMDAGVERSSYLFSIINGRGGTTFSADEI